MGDVRAAVGRRVRELRENAGISQEELGGRAGLSRNSIGSIERAEFEVGVESLSRIASGLGISLAEFFRPFGQVRGARAQHPERG